MTSLKILDFDIENRPLAYLGSDYTTAEITAIAACWHRKPKTMRVWLLGRDAYTHMLEEFKGMYTEADIVTGHYIRNHDLPIINGACLEMGLAPLEAKLTIDTKNDLMTLSNVSKSQENLGEMYGIRAKVHMNNTSWREANRLTDAGLTLTAKRVIGDVLQHMKLRDILTEREVLRVPSVWSPRA